MKAPYRVLYSNDTTNIETCVSPHQQARQFQPYPAQNGKLVYPGAPFTPEMLEASVDETANVGIDVHMLQPGMGTVPWWKSTVYPFAEHVRFMKEQFGMTPDRSEPYNNPYPALLGVPEQHRAWIVPVGILKDGLNTVNITLVTGAKPAVLVFLDVAVE